jgi:MarR family transcriptional regulator, 2-MHQ and catechol-resistance regulon repressor
MNDLKTITILFRAKNHLDDLIKAQTERFGLNPTEFAALEVLYHKGPLTPNVISTKVLIAQSSMSYVIQRLVEKGLIERTVTHSDKRSAQLNLSSSGKDLMDRMYPDHVATLRQTLDQLSPSEEQILQDLLKRIGKST